MASHFDFLAQAKPGSLHKLLEKLSTADAAIVLTGLPHGLAVQALAFFPDDKQRQMLPAMQDARKVSDDLRQKTAQKIRAMLDAAKSARDGKTAVTPKPAQSPRPQTQPGKPASGNAPFGNAFSNALGGQPEPANAPAPRQAGPMIPGGVPSTPGSLFGMDPNASILSGGAPEPDELPGEAPAVPTNFPITPRFTPPKISAGQRQQPGQQPGRELGQEQPAAPVPNAPPRPAPRPANPYTQSPPPQSHEFSAEPVAGDHAPNSGELIGQAISDLGNRIKQAFTPAARTRPPAANPPAPEQSGGFRTKDPAASRSVAPGARKKPDARPQDSGKPVPWVPRAATSSPINGPALPGKPPPVTGDPLESPLAQSGLLDLIGRAQEKFMPKGTVKTPGRPPQKTPPTPPPPRARQPRTGGRPEPREGVVRMDSVKYNATPRVIGPRPKAEELVGRDSVPVSGGARRMDGKAILAAILRNATPEVRGTVKQDDPRLFKELHGRMFFFDDLIYTEDSALARVFTAAPAETAALALKFAAPALRKRVLAAVSPGRARALGETPKRAGMDDVEAAQQQVLNVALQLQAAGRILIDPRDPDLAGA